MPLDMTQEEIEEMLDDLKVKEQQYIKDKWERHDYSMDEGIAYSSGFADGMIYSADLMEAIGSDLHKMIKRYPP